MQAAPVRNAAVPSLQLLKFLRAQNSGAVYFTANCSREKYSATPRRQSRTKSDRGIATFAPSYPFYAPSEYEGLAVHPSHHKPWFSRRESVPLESSLFSLKSHWLQRKGISNSTVGPPSDVNTPISSRYATTSIEEDASYKSHPPPNQMRTISTTSNREIFRRLLWQRQNRQKTPLQPNDLPHLASVLEDSATFGRALRPANELKLRCTEFDENGNVTLVNGEFKKSELIAKYGLLPRDLRKIDSSLLPNILVRPSAILINLYHLRVLIKHNRVLVFDAYGSTDSYTQSLFMYDLENKLQSPSLTSPASPFAQALPYEFRALEAVLISVTSGLESEFEGVREPVVRVLRELEEDIDRDKLRHLLIYSKKLGTFEQKARLVRDAIDDLLEADDDLADMYLTEKAVGTERADDEHTEVEMLLESYHKVADEIVQAAGNLVSNIRNTEEIVKAILDANRNSLMLLDLKFSIGTLGIGGGTFVAALYGMNLKNFIEETDLGFWAVSAWCTVFSVIVCAYGLRKLRRVQRVSMWGSERGDPTRGKSGWARLGGVAGERPMELEPLVGSAWRERERARVVGGVWGSGCAVGGGGEDGSSAERIEASQAPSASSSSSSSSFPQSSSSTTTSSSPPPPPPQTPPLPMPFRPRKPTRDD